MTSYYAAETTEVIVVENKEDLSHGHTYTFLSLTVIICTALTISVLMTP